MSAEAHDNSWPSHFRASLALGLPLIGTQLAQMGINFVDLVMLGWLGVDELAASVLATTLFFVVLVVGFGLAQAAMPLVAQAYGQGDSRMIRRSVRMSLWTCGIYGILLMPVLWFAEPILLLLGQEPDLSARAAEYVRVIQWSVFPVLLIATLRSYLSAMERMQIVLLITLLSLGLNALLNWMFIFGNFGAPRLELAGAALASLITNIVGAAIIVIYVLRVPQTRAHEIFVRFFQPDWEAFRRVLRLGIPIALSILAEVSMFSVAAIFMGWIGKIELASHGIVLQLASISFMIPLSFSQVATVRIGHAIGRKDSIGLGRAGIAVFVLGVGFAFLAAACFLIFPASMISIYLDNDNVDAPAIIAYGIPLLALAAAFQVGDSLQVIGQSCLRGLQDTKIPMYIAVFSYWAVGMPAAYLLAFKAGYGGQGIWMGLALGLSVAAVFMCARYYYREKLDLVRF